MFSYVYIFFSDSVSLVFSSFSVGGFLSGILPVDFGETTGRQKIDGRTN